MKDYDEVEQNVEQLENEFKALSLAEKKQILSEIVDNNNLYVNYSDIEDETYNISAEEKILNKEFYGDLWWIFYLNNMTMPVRMDL